MTDLLKLLRYARIYGIGRAALKAAGRLRIPLPQLSWVCSGNSQIAVIGTGQFAYSTIGYFLPLNTRLIAAFDTDEFQCASFCRQHGGKVCGCVTELLNLQPEILYIASNHSSHSDYAIAAMEAGIRHIYLEKPISVDSQQLARLLHVKENTDAQLYCGYNRPFSAAIRQVRSHFDLMDPNSAGPLTFNAFVTGHLIPDDHWYRDPAEGTRVCGNVGHWIDLFVHCLCWKGLPKEISVCLSYSDRTTTDDNFSLCITTDNNDIGTITLTSRCEPYEGIDETINLNCGEVIAKIDDFRRMTIRCGNRLTRKKFFPKDVGHKAAIRQPFAGESMDRDWNEVVLSSRIMLAVADAVRNGTTSFSAKLTDYRLQIDSESISQPSATQTVGPNL